MEHKPIYLDGVDVSGCRHLKNDGIKKPICRSGGCTAIYKSCLCADNTDCDYKQLARKTKECEALKSESFTMDSLITEQEEEIKELKKYAQAQENQREIYYKEFLKLSQECEELRSECGELFNAKLEILRDLDHYKRAYYGCSKRIEEHLVIRAPLPPPEFVDSRYRKALEEIEGIASKDYYDDTWADISIKIDKILNIINKAKGKTND